MSRRPARADIARGTGAPDALEAIDLGALDQVTGGRITPRTTLDPVLLEGITQLAQAIMAVGQNLAAAKQASSQQMMQVIMQMMQERR